MFSIYLASVIASALVHASPISVDFRQLEKRWEYNQYFDLQGHRGGRGDYIENTLPSFAGGLIAGVTTLEMDTGLTKDGTLVVWHDESIDPLKCLDTAPAFPNDPMYPYVGKYIANLTLAQVKTLDCGSERQIGFPLQITVPGTRISTLAEMFEFVQCATDLPVLFNIESKVDGDYHNRTRTPEDFVDAMVKMYRALGPAITDRISHQSFDWRALVYSKKIMPELRTACLCDDTTLWQPLAPGQDGNLTTHGNGPSNWLAGIDIDKFNGTVGEKVASAANSIRCDFLSTATTAYATPSNITDVTQAGYIPFTTRDMVAKAHSYGMLSNSWTPDRLNNIEYLHNISVDGVITDYPRDVRVWALSKGIKLAPRSDSQRVNTCLAKYNEVMTPK